MRYFIVKYVRRMVRKGFKMEPQMDEQVSVSKKIKTSDIQSAAVILDFKQQQVLQATLDGITIPKDWDRILGFYYQHYKHVIDRLAAENGLEIAPEPTADITVNKETK